MFVLSITDDGHTYEFASRDEEDFMDLVLENELVQFWLDNAIDEDTGEHLFDEDHEWTSASQLVEDIVVSCCGEANISYKEV